MEKLAFGMPADQVDLVRVCDLVDRYGCENGWNSLTVMRVNLMVEELALNFRDYGAVPGRRLDVAIQSGDGGVTLDFCDDGVPFNPVCDGEAPDLCAGLEERKVGGLGLHLVRSLADTLDYRYEGGRNLLSLSLNF